jgi:outer membrane protein TolC
VRAVQQVDDAGAAFHAQQERLADLDRALTAAREATRIATERYDRGLTDFLNVLDAERQQFDLEENQVAARQVEAEALVGLFRALGGGWPLKQTLPDIPKPQPAVAAAVKYLMNPGQGPLNPAGSPSQ